MFCSIHNRITAIVIMSVIFSACDKKEPIGKANFYFSTTASTEFQHLDLKFERLSILLLNFDAIPRQISNQSQTLEFNLTNPHRQYLGSSDYSFKSLQRNGSPNKYEIWFRSSEYRLNTDTAQITLNHLIDINRSDFQKHDTAHAHIISDPGEEIDILIEIDIDNSVILDSAGENWIAPKILLTKI